MAHKAPRAADAAAVRFPPPLIFLGFLLLGLLVDRLLALPPLTIPWWLGAIVAVGGAAVQAAVAGTFRRHGETLAPWTSTGGIIGTGLYAHSRNPMYLGMALIGIGLAIVCHSMMGVLFVLVAMVVVGSTVIAREEAYLENKFGDAYRRYRTRVRRWL